MRVNLEVWSDEPRPNTEVLWQETAEMICWLLDNPASQVWNLERTICMI